MYLQQDGQLLKTKIVATIGEPRGRIFDPDEELVKKVVQYPTLFSWFVKEGTNRFIVNVLRINMAFYKDGVKERTIFQWMRDNQDGMAKNVAVLADLPGPKIRLGDVGAKPIKLSKDQHFCLYFGGNKNKNTNEPSVLVYDEPFARMVSKIDSCSNIGDYIRNTISNNREVIMSIGDGKVILKAIGEKDGVVESVVDKEGNIEEKQGLTIRGASLDIPSFQQRDREALDFLLENGEDYLAFIGLSFVKNAQDVLDVKHHIENYLMKKLRKEAKGKKFKERTKDLVFKPENVTKEEEALRKEARLRAPSVIAKIETRQGCDNIDEILDVADGVMVARGDLALQLDPQVVPSIQKKIIRKCNFRGKPVITATEMLSSMENSPSPTRAEATDVFNAILDGSDAVMLSGETSKGKYPAHAVRMMARIAEEAEIHLKRSDLDENLRSTLDRQRFQEVSSGSESLLEDNDKRFNDWIDKASRRIPDLSGSEREWWEWIRDFYAEKLSKSEKQRTTDSISESACILSEEKKYSAIIASTLTGRTARMISRFRPDVRIIGVVHDTINSRKLMLSFGTYPVNIDTKCKKAGSRFNTTDEIFEQAINTAKTEGYIQAGNMVIFVAGTPLWTLGEANLIQIKEVM